MALLNSFIVFLALCCREIVSSQQRLVIEQNGLKFGDSGILVTQIYDTFDLVWFNVILESFGALECLKMSCISKTVGRRAKLGDIWESWILVAHMGYI